MNAKKPRLRIAKLLGEGLTCRQVATLTGCSVRTIQRAKTEIQTEIGQNENVQNEYAKLLHESLPLPERVAKYREIVNGEDHRNSLQALMRVDDLCAIVTEKDKLRQPREVSQVSHAPLFLMPAGTTVNVSVHSGRPQALEGEARRLEADSSEAALEEDSGSKAAARVIEGERE